MNSINRISGYSLCLDSMLAVSGCFKCGKQTARKIDFVIRTIYKLFSTNFAPATWPVVVVD